MKKPRVDAARNLRQLLLLLATAGICLPLQAEEIGWRVSPVVGLSQLYSDNIALAPSGERQDEFISRLDAGLGVLATTRRFRARLDYNLLGLAYWDNSDFNDIFHQGRAGARFDAVPDRFYIDSTLNYDQRLRARSGVAGDIVNIGVDRTDVFRFGITPTFEHRFSNWADLKAFYSYDRVDYEVSDLRDLDSQSHQIAANLKSGSAFATFGWELDFDREEIDFDDGSSVTFQSAELLGRWFVSPQFNVFASIGDERNDFEQDPRRARPDDSFWRAGAAWQPSARTSLEAFVGERFFGTTFGLDVQHRIRDGRLFVDYSEDLTTVSRRGGGVQIGGDGSIELDPITGLPVFEDPDLIAGVFLLKRLSAGMALNRPRTDLSMRIYNNRRELERSNRRERSLGLIANAEWRAFARTSLYGDLRYEETDFAGIENRDDTIFSLSLGARRALGRSTSASVDYRFTDRDSNATRFDYRENRISLSLTHQF